MFLDTRSGDQATAIQPAIEREVAAGELRRSASTQFDPEVVEAFLETLTREP